MIIDGSPLVSVIIPIYNVEKYIEKCITSVMEQTYQKLEIICVNDGNPDSSMDIVQKKAQIDARINIVNIPNSGLSIARNTGLQHANGKYIFFLDSDDCLAPDTLAELVPVAEKNRADVCFFNAECIFESEEIAAQQRGYAAYYNRKSKYSGCYNGQELFTLMLENSDFKPSACLQMISRVFLIENKLMFYPGILHEDNLFTVLEMKRAERVIFVDRPFYKRLVRGNSITSSKKSISHAYGFYICHREMLLSLQKENYSIAYFKALQKYMNLMRNNAIDNIRHLGLDVIAEQIDAINENDTPLFLDYIYDRYEAAREKKVQTPAKARKKQVKIPEVVKNKLVQSLPKVRKKSLKIRYEKLKKGYTKVKNVFKKVRRKIYYLIPELIRWGFSTWHHCGVQYFIYRKQLKMHPDKICVSIIVPVYNVEKYLPDMLDSVLKQKLRNIEIICVDDGSTDSSLQILQEYQQMDKRIIILQQENIGAGAARNYGMSVAKGEYLLFLDADDIFNENLCNEVYYQCMRKNADICLFGSKRLNMQTMDTEPMKWVLREEEIPVKNLFSGYEMRDRLFQITTGCPWSKMFKKEFVETHQLKFQNLKNTNDAFFVRMGLVMAERITTVKKSFVTYRYNEGNNTQSRKARAPLAFYTAFKAMKEYMLEKGVYDAFEKTYCNMVLTESLFALRTVGTEAAEQQVKDLLIKEAVAFYGLLSHDESYFYNKNDFMFIKELCQHQ